MAREKKDNQLEAPVEMAARLFSERNEMVINAITGPPVAQRKSMIGNVPVDPIIDSIVGMVPEG